MHCGIIIGRKIAILCSRKIYFPRDTIEAGNKFPEYEKKKASLRHITKKNLILLNVLARRFENKKCDFNVLIVFR